MNEKLKKRMNDVVFILQFTIDDFKGKYAGSVLGMLWAFLQPVITITLYWFVFQFGFRSTPVKDYPYVLWLIAGILPWFFLGDSITNATTSMTEYSYLVKKVLFNIKILPLAKVLSVLIVQIVLVILAILVYAICGHYPDVYYLQLFIYIPYMIILVTGITYFTATLHVFFRDTIQIVAVITQIIFWGTPIVWDFSVMPVLVQKILAFNPFYYIVNGYRNVFIYKNGMNCSFGMTFYYWSIAIVILCLGLKIFSKCKDHFADII